ncbi:MULTISPECIES: hypothetical protein [Bacillus]|uniref:Lipoprotein n=2 Tax=Bacillus toyonensis TaxID=155322 RepID=A0A2C4PH72_9BACI|nr:MULTISPECIES: hypothetical protein [Bacillus]EEL59018.1 hypothetical protein bcere0024_010270 [Bacillus cereus Rock4-18]OFC96282.1 lipoprotein [Bacillus thuringiensis]OTW92181.1 hypothetical protein BK702_07520 [Bacillus thuringiensis serovar cameroun]OTX03719.1 hypothetical protein BK712_20015 [Bacillus thuringiensis serovar seoulensis]OTX39173.1 hypothetical protein BK717_08630 [Bacillus thuringiensis serovar malayensis]OUB05889.1 hypothetical protein BK709_16085 [Bacillus thuringiensis 
MKRLSYFLFFILICLVSAGCAKDKEGEKLEYNGRALVIGVVGEKPKDTFRNIKFEEMKLEELEKKSKEVDGFLIMKDHFQEASTEQYKSIFSSLKKPVFFIGLQDKSYSTFITKGIEYNSARKDVNAMYTQGFANIGSGEGQQWAVGLSNGGNTEESIHNMYIVVFQTIADYLSR